MNNQHKQKSFFGYFNPSVVSGTETVLRITVGILLLWAGWLKMVQPHDFLFSVYEYQLFPEGIGYWIALLIPCLEIVLGLCLLLGWLLDGALIVSSMVLSAFVLLLTITLFRGLETSCGCFVGAGQDGHIDYWTLLRTSVLTLLVLALTTRHIMTRRRKCRHSLP